MAIKKEIFKAIQTRIQEKAPSIKWVDKLFGQTQNITNYVMNYPAVLIEYGQFTPYSNLNGIQEGTLEIIIHLFVENYSDAHLGSRDQEYALLYFDILDELHEALNTLSGENFSTLERIGEDEDNDHDNIIETIIRYNCGARDIGGKKKGVKSTGEITPKATYKKAVIKPENNTGGFKI